MNSCCSELPVAGTAHIRLPPNTYNWLLLDGPILVMAHLNPSLILLFQRASSYQCPSLLRCLMTYSISSLQNILLQQAFLHAMLLAFLMFSQSFLWAHTCKATSQVHHHLTPTLSYSMGLCHQQHVWYILDAPQQEKHNMKHKELTRKRHPCMNRHASTSSKGATLETTLT